MPSNVVNVKEKAPADTLTVLTVAEIVTTVVVVDLVAEPLVPLVVVLESVTLFNVVNAKEEVPADTLIPLIAPNETGEIALMAPEDQNAALKSATSSKRESALVEIPADSLMRWVVRTK